MNDQPKLLSAAPVLPALDMRVSVAFYVEKLGFRVDFDYGNYVGLERDGVALHLVLADEHVTGEHAGLCVIYVRGVESLYAHCAAQGIVHPNGALEEKPWGVKEFVVLDPVNTGLRIMEVLPE